jgi:hypothetical protein
VDRAIKGTSPGAELLIYDAYWTADRNPETGAWEDRTLSISTENHEIAVGDRLVLALIREDDPAGTFGVNSRSAYFLLDATGEAIVATERSNPTAAEAQRLPLEQLVSDLQGP